VRESLIASTGISLARRPFRPAADAAPELIKIVNQRCVRVRFIVPAAALALVTAIASGGALGVDGRDGGSQLGCGAVTDGRGGAVSGRAGGNSVSTRLHRECASRQAVASPRAPALKRREGSEQQPAPPPPVPDAVRVSILPGPVSLPATAQETPSAVRGDFARASATVVTGGVLVWFLQSSLWAGLLMLGVPIWRHVDLLPVLDQAGDVEEADRATASEAREDSALAQVLDAGGSCAPVSGESGSPA
jgi:hypothetical protein